MSDRTSQITSRRSAGIWRLDTAAGKTVDQTNQNEDAVRGRAIADFCGVSAPTVSKHRRRLQEEGLLPEIQDRTDKSGRQLNTKKIGTKANHKEKILKIASELDLDEIREVIELLEAMLW